ncbi:hypothetical protein [Streptomyces netropsis]|uniref:Uncharacterized protein n=1 Tax=Streptomyces netropsis TaxID=55404 RepID=A0A7W7LI37_STRNE|nr:hypothetical protein [Streptomyces netropsis]MBB4890096.1 hypothetical protein [Streptomyces netropsis]GGR43270.1 hypothetical protein GCM10010219_56020 [Streptomyces netropsis]
MHDLTYEGQPTALDRLRTLGMRYLNERTGARRRAEEGRRRRERDFLPHQAYRRIARDFPATLGSALTLEDFTGFPHVHHEDIRAKACAVAYLGDGLWLHFSSARFTFLRRCPCSRYSEHFFDNEAQFAVALTEGFADTRHCTHQP